MSYSTPILYLIFNRPECTSRVFEKIREQKPQYLYIAADGPRQNNESDIEKCRITRKLVLENIDWNCEVKTLFRDENLGCGKAVSEAITWFFEQVQEGVIFEDDCLPDKSFFNFCQELLAKYKYDEQIMHIGGNNFQSQNTAMKYSYYFSNYIHVWGWATWRRAWEKYEYKIPADQDGHFRDILENKFSNKLERAYWKNSFENIVLNRIDTWDIQWSYTIYKNKGIGITPSKNLVSNIGFDENATHTKSFDKNNAELPLNELPIIKHRSKIKILYKADRFTFKKLYSFGNSYFNRIKFKIGIRFPYIKKLYLKLLN